MNQKNFAIIFTVVVLLVMGFLGTKQFIENANIAYSPTPSSSGLDLGIVGERQESIAQSQVRQQQQPQQQMQQQAPSPQPSAKKKYSSFPRLSPEQLTNKRAVIQTDKGVIEFEIYPEATKAASSFIFLANEGFYDSLTFHRVEKGFVIQGGDPNGNGTGGPGYNFEDEPVTKSYSKGIVAMANAGPNTNGSQFFIMLEDNITLPPKYTIFGKVISGQTTVDSIVRGDIMKRVYVK